ncbi:ceramide synthase 6-like isoform X1 [Penaeus monodon]|uniref:ceramide synthase 6-like isoform X1 n=2 Tax=Penaeus monodon TaxID=6687 RepID=UPI0018A726C5|nr:ceramide synthase 6-like isoform X1 [Penaeus monodon]
MLLGRMAVLLSWGESLSAWFWKPEVWLIRGYTWDSLAQAEHFQYPVFSDLWTYPFAIAAALLVLRYFVLNPFVFTPTALALGVSNNQQRPPPPNRVLEAVFRRHRNRTPAEVISKAARESGFSERKVERWLRQRVVSARSTDVEKFNDCAWQALYYSLYCVMGFVVLWDKAWLWDIKHCWYDYPEQSVDNDIWWYYMTALGFYWCMTLTHFIQHQRKDSLQMFIHHVLTIMLIVFSWTVNFVRLGSLVLIVHECADIPMLFAKMSKLFGRRDLMDKFFVVFVLLWLSTRTGLFPLWILNNSLFEAHVILDVELIPVYYIFNGMMLTLFLIHVVWTYLILRILVTKLLDHKLEDLRSSSDASADEDERATKKGQ